jgi:uncharacterized protein YjbJ (UPF0337 family)
MDKDRIAGAAKKIMGSIKETIGKAAGDAKLEAEGKADKVVGRVQNAIVGLKDALKVRTFRRSSARSGMTFTFVQALIVPTVTTAESAIATSRDTTVCRRITADAAITTGSILFFSIEPCAPRPNNVAS